jgi:TRAP-type C4-dicarboxylate transport system substrate-binding protein
MNLKFASAYNPPGTDMAGDAAKFWMDTVTKNSGGQIQFTTYFGGALGTGAAHWDLLQNGVIDAGLLAEAHIPAKLPMSEIEYCFPFGPSDPKIVLEAKKQFLAKFPQPAADEAKLNAIRLAIIPHDGYSFFGKLHVKTLDDLKGKKVAAVGRFFPRWVVGNLATAVSATQFERYEMLRTGIIDLDWLPESIQYIVKLHEQAKYSTHVGATAPAPWGVHMNLNLYNSLPDAVKKIMLDAGEATGKAEVEQIIPAWQAKQKEAWDKAGVEYYTMPDTEIVKWLALAPDIPSEWAKEMTSKGYPGFEMVKFWQETTAKLGWKWAREWGKQ